MLHYKLEANGQKENLMSIVSIVQSIMNLNMKCSRYTTQDFPQTVQYTALTSSGEEFSNFAAQVHLIFSFIFSLLCWYTHLEHKFTVLAIQHVQFICERQKLSKCFKGLAKKIGSKKLFLIVWKKWNNLLKNTGNVEVT